MTVSGASGASLKRELHTRLTRSRELARVRQQQERTLVSAKIIGQRVRTVMSTTGHVWDEHVQYLIEFQWEGSGAELAWRRYSSFRQLRQKLKASGHAVPEIDGKRLFNNKHEKVLAKRRSSLGLLLQFIVDQGIAGKSDFCRSFFDLHQEEKEDTGDSDSFLFKWSGVCY